MIKEKSEECAEMKNFKKHFINTAIKYADYVGMKISAAVEIKQGSTLFESQLQAAKVMYEEIRALNELTEAVRKMEEAMPGEIDLAEAEMEEITLTPEQEEELKNKVLFAISKDNETGEIEISPMNEKNCITLHGAEGVEWFIKRLRETIQS